MAFTTTTGSGGTSLIGTSGVDTTAITPSTLTTAVFIGAQGDNDIVTTVAGGATANKYSVYFGAGNDTANFGAAMSSSLASGDDGNDTFGITAALTNSTVRGMNGTDTITSTAAITGSFINGNNDNDTINLSGAITSSTVVGGQGDDTFAITGGSITGGRINGQDGADTITITGFGAMTAGATIFGGQGGDVINGAGNAANLILSGDEGNDRLTSGGGSDTLYGGNGTDLIAGGAANDTMVGGAGIDTFTALTTAGGNTTVGVAANSNNTASVTIATGGTYANANIVDVITDFAAGAGGDVIDVATAFTAIQTAAGNYGNGTTLVIGGIGSGLVNGNVYAVSGTYAAGQFTSTANGTGADTLVFTAATGGATDLVVLQNVNNTQLTLANFA